MHELPFDWLKAKRHISRRDKKMGAVLRRVGDVPLTLNRLRSPFHALVRAIIYQQLSGKAAATIHGRVLDLFPGKRITPARLIETPVETLRGAGCSGGKTKALRDLAARTIAGEVPSYGKLEKMEDAEIIERLTKVHGVGRWTVEMLLMFRLGRPDVMPSNDLGVQKGFALAHGLDALPKPDELTEHTECWRPYRTVGAWYCWRALE